MRLHAVRSSWARRISSLLLGAAILAANACDSSSSVSRDDDSGGGSFNNSGNGSGNSNGSGNNSGSGDGGSGGSGLGSGGSGPVDGLAYPLTLTPIGSPQTSTANVALYFTVTDATGEPVTGLKTEKFVAAESGTALDPFESAFRVQSAEGRLSVPTVLLLDLSRSVVEAGALEQLKSAARSVVDSLGASQRLALLTFADNVTNRTQDLGDNGFSSDKTKLRSAIDSIKMADGVSTNLYGALGQGYSLWQDGFYESGSTGKPELVAGLLIVVTDGNDTAGVSTLSQAREARGNKRTIFIRVGSGIDSSVAEDIGNVGVIDASAGFSDLDKAVQAAIARTSKLNQAIYVAEYCSPKRAGQHSLLFTVDGNQPYLDGGSGPAASCDPSGSGPTKSGQVFCGWESSAHDRYLTCDTTAPYWCRAEGKCYKSADDAAATCGSSCIACGVSEEPSVGSTATGGFAIETSFNASGFNSAQCDALFNAGSGGASGTGGSSSGSNGVGGSGPFPSDICKQALDCCLTTGNLPSCTAEVGGKSDQYCDEYLFAKCKK